MIIIYHKNNKVVKVIRDEENLFFSSHTIAGTINNLAELYPQDWLIWCDLDLKPYLNLSKFKSIFHHHKIMTSFGQSHIPVAIGYVEESPFVKINKMVAYPTWLMSAEAGGVHASVLKTIGSKIKTDTSFDYFINSLAKLGMPAGLFCYSDPRLLTNPVPKIQKGESTNHYILFRFVSQHYKKRWLLLLFVNLMLFEKRFPVIPFLYGCFFQSRKKTALNLEDIPVQSALEPILDKTIDVIIPTIGRKQYLYDVLKDLANQTHLPKRVIIVEQNPLPDSLSELDYLTNQSWPFTIKHIFTHQAGACNARNLALNEVESEWVFMADDDIRLHIDFFNEAFDRIKKLGIGQITFGCYAVNYVQKEKKEGIFQWSSFGSGCSIVKKQSIDAIKYNLHFEFGYGEDADFGMQLRNKGLDVVFSSRPEITHLKAVVGGFRTILKKPWDDDIVQPKPSPTVMLFKIKHYTKQQLLGYKIVLFLKYYKIQKIKNPILYYKNFQKQWKQSVFWANKLK
ncbi:glycosyltransferase family 2 protein [Flavobacterium daejeonense]|uniref:glycosyltransferase family 2 protein n=1 Tax=Flavobacterium daejeonense TaxID=350893 RepID=UPI00047B88A0|nr:glycosyltransferase family A protein [Flavobacterium daejeonense]